MNRNLEEIMTAFRIAMGTKMLEKYYQGYSGWDDPAQISNDTLLIKIETNIEDGDWVDVANLAAILWHRNVTPQRIRLDCESAANHNLNRLLDKPGVGV